MDKKQKEITSKAADSLEISVIICTHNPRQDYLRQTLEHLRTQNLSTTAWELLIVDNRSDPLVSSWCDLSWHPQGRIVREESLGLTNARLCGIANTTGDLLVFVDDDNLLANDYLAEALRISKEYPFLGAWGGQLEPVFEVEPEEWLHSFHLAQLAIRAVSRVVWTNMYQPDATPVGAGMCIRRSIAEKYCRVLKNDPLRRSLDRAGASLSGCGDHDMAFTACDEGLGVGLFPSLSLKHLMPEFRIREDYLLRIIEGTNFSAAILRFCRDGTLPRVPRMHALRRAWLWLRLRRFNPYERRKFYAGLAGTERALKLLRNHAGQTSGMPK